MSQQQQLIQVLLTLLHNPKEISETNPIYSQLRSATYAGPLFELLLLAH